MAKKNVLVFGGGPIQLSIINNAKELGFFVIVIDPDINAVGKKIAHKFYRIDGDDFDSTLQIAQKYDVKGIVTAATDKPLLMMARIAKKLSLNFPTYESVDHMIDKYKLKQILKKNNLKHAEGKKYDTFNLPEPETLNYPVIIKPTSSSGSKGVVLCDSIKTFEKSIEETISQSNGEILIENYISGDEISVEALVYDNKVKILQITDKVITPSPFNVEIAHSQPSRFISSHKTEIQDYLQKLINILELNNCAIHPEFIINDNGVFLIEMSPRLGGDFITSHLVPLSTGINIEKELLHIATNTNVDVNITKNNAALVNFFNLPVGAIVKESIDIDKYYIKYPNLDLLETTLLKGDVINEITNSLNRYGHFIISNKDDKVLLKINKEISNSLIHNLS